ncbi:unnamed protein product [Sphacelaria rigidula]
MQEFLAMPESDQGDLTRQLADWDPAKKTKVMKTWEATDPALPATFLLELIRGEQARGDGPGNLWQCSLCPLKREVEIEEKLKRGEHRRRDRSLDPGAIYEYNAGSRGRGVSILYRSPHETLFEFRNDMSSRLSSSSSSGINSNTKSSPETRGIVLPGERTGATSIPTRDRQQIHQEPTSSLEVALPSAAAVEGCSQFPRLTYGKRGFDGRRLCESCAAELRGAIVMGGHDMELWHAVDHERRAMHQQQRRQDVFKARWAERERADRQVSQLLRLICEANLAAFSRHTLEARTRAAQDNQAAEIRRMLDLKLSDQNAVRVGTSKDHVMKLLNVREAEANCRLLRLKACLNTDRHYGSLEPGGVPPSSRRRHPMSSKPADFLDDGTPATAQGATLVFGRPEPIDDDESADIRCWKAGSVEAEERLDRRREVREWQTAYGKRGRFSYLCSRWVDAASSIEERQRQKRMVEAAERARRVREREAAKLKRKQQLVTLRAKAVSRANVAERRQDERNKEKEARRAREAEELDRMRIEEGKQLAAGDRFWGLVVEMQRLRAIEEQRRLLWEARVKATREKMVSVRCISEASSFSYAIPPPDPDLANQIARLVAM